MLSTKIARDIMQIPHLPDPAKNHCSSLCAPVQFLVMQKHIVPSVLDLEVIMPEEIPDNIQRRVFEDSANTVLRRPFHNETKRPNILIPSSSIVCCMSKH